MAKINFQSNPKVRNIFDDLDTYRAFCVDYGYKFDEATLYDMRSYVYRQHQKQLAGKSVKDNWEDAITR
jgi:hypothetical protein